MPKLTDDPILDALAAYWLREHRHGVDTSEAYDSLRELLAKVRDGEREASAAYCLDRADQYETSSGTWVGIANCAEGIAKGEAATSMSEGDTADLVERVRSIAGFTRPTPKPSDRPRNRTPLTRDKIGGDVVADSTKPLRPLGKETR